jgi:hypothetical protein
MPWASRFVKHSNFKMIRYAKKLAELGGWRLKMRSTLSDWERKSCGNPG